MSSSKIAHTGKTLRPGTLLLLALLCSLSWIQQEAQDFQADDAFISYRYAVNWAQGHGPVFNPGERVEGYTNFLLVALEALARAAGADVVFVSRALGSVCCFGLIGLMFLALRMPFRRSTAVALAGSACLALHAGLAVFARSGLETVLLA